MSEKDASFREFFEAEYRPLRRFGYLLTGDWSEAEDLTQDALLRTYRAWSRIRDRERPGAYARTVLVNRHRSVLRHLKIVRKHATDEVEAVRLLGEDGLVVWDALLRLPERQRAALALRYYEDLPEAEIAVILDCPLGTVKSLIHRGLEKMRTQLEPTYDVAIARGDAS
ncbi:MAG: SigE family RNA polymerase sigma factor [Actinomycetota bacterium]|nr:SigE family RNA polymerase sigma factor [Actinomycetota bacterium]